MVERERVALMDIKMIVTDLDDTLLHRDKTVSEYTADVLRRCRELGIKTVIATGRGHPEVVAPIELFDGIIANNGANIFEGYAELRRCIPYAEARPLLLVCHARGINLRTQYGGMNYVNYDFTELKPNAANYKAVDFSAHALDCENITFEWITPEDAEFIKLHLTANMYLKVLRGEYGMIMHSKATKSAGAAELAERWGIARSEIAAFGDDLNDIDMLNYAGISVAVKNALDEVKAAAGYICDDCDNDGVAKWLEENVL
jgi:Cof subfamily protein (haloacid dehalogenase superfamily)